MTYHARLLFYLLISVSILGISLVLKEEEQSTSAPTLSTIARPSVLGSSQSKTWEQISFTGGINDGPYTIPWGGSGGWSYYSSQLNTIIDGSGVRSADGNPAELVSSIFDQGNYRAKAIANTGSLADGSLTNYDVSVRGADSPSAVTSAQWTVAGVYTQCPLPYRYIQYKIPLPINPSNLVVNKVRFVGELQIAYGNVNNTGGKPISGATVTVNNSSVTTSSTTNPAYALPISFMVGGTVTVTVSAPGYVTQTKTFTMSTTPAGCSQDIEANFVLTKASSSSQPTSPTTTPTATADITKVTLPTKFTQPGSTTTDVAKISDPKNVQALTLDVVGKSKIIFQEPVDLSSQSAVDVFAKLDQYVKAEKTGVVEVDSKAASFLNKKATILIYNLPFTSTPKVLVDGKENPQIVSSVLYSKGTLSFTAAHFTKFEAVENKSTLTQVKTNNQALLLGGLVVLLVILVGGSLGYLFKTGRLSLGSKKKEA